MNVGSNYRHKDGKTGIETDRWMIQLLDTLGPFHQGIKSNVLESSTPGRQKHQLKYCLLIEASRYKSEIMYKTGQILQTCL